MSEKHYQISPIELVRWAEHLFGDGEAEGLSEELIASYEKAAGRKLPAALREYYLTCGQAGLNRCLHEMFTPDRDASPFEQHLTFSYDYILDDMKWVEEKGKGDYKELAQLRTLPRERWGEVVDNYLIFWSENQGYWLAGIKAEDLGQPDPVVYYNDNDDMYHWVPFADSVQSFLLGIILEVLEYETDAETDGITDSEDMQKVLEEAGVDFQRLQEPYPFSGGYFAHTCLDMDTDTLYVYGEERENRPACLKVFRHVDKG